MGSARLALAAVVLAAGAFLGEAGGAGSLRWIDGPSGRAFSLPCDVAADRRGVIFLLEAGQRSIHLFTARGEYLRTIQGKGEWKDPQALAVGPGGSIFLADGTAGRVLEIDLLGKVRREFRAGGSARITGVGVFGGAVYCVDNRNDRVLVFRKPGAPPERWGRRGDGPGKFHAPYRLAIDGAGRVFVTDVLNARVQWFSAFGAHLGSLRRFGAGTGRLLRPGPVALDQRGRIWVGDAYTGFVELFDESGVFVQAVALRDRPVLFGDPAGLAVSPAGLWIADQKEGRVALFQK